MNTTGGSNSGRGLIEVMIVAIVIVVILSVFYPVYIKAVKKARELSEAYNSYTILEQQIDTRDAEAEW
jgi:type II secretory pathway pseudopilin PulG